MRSQVSHILTFSHSLNQLKERHRAQNGSIMSRKPGKGPIVTGQLSEKARRILLKRSRANSLNLAAAKLRRRKKLAAKGWSATRIQDEQTNLVSFDIYGPTKGGGTFTVSIPAEQREEQKRVRKTLQSYGAALPGQFDDDLAFLEKLFNGANVSPYIATSKPGFTDTGKGFVLGAQMLGDAADRYLWLGEEYSTLGQTAGTREGWNEVGKLLQHSSFATIAVLTVLASPVPAYVLLRKSEDPRWRPALSETAINNFAGDSGSGKTLATAIAASLTGDPSDRAKWDFSRRGLEEHLHTRNQVGAIFDDVEKHTGESMPLRRAITTVTQSLPDGASKVVSRVARDLGLPRLTWSTFGLSSSPRPMSASLPAVAAASLTPLRRVPAMWLSSRDGLPERWNAGSLFTTGMSCGPGLRCSWRTITSGPCWHRRTISSRSLPAPARVTMLGSRASSASCMPLASSRLSMASCP